MSQPFVFSAAERAHYAANRALAKDARGREILIGLSFEETAWYLRQTHLLLGRHRADRLRYVELHHKHEAARLDRSL